MMSGWGHASAPPSSLGHVFDRSAIVIVYSPPGGGSSVADADGRVVLAGASLGAGADEVVTAGAASVVATSIGVGGAGSGLRHEASGRTAMSARGRRLGRTRFTGRE
jgi:hypothetical protein